VASDTPKQRATPPLLKRLNERAILETIRSEAPISRAEIARRAGISKPTVSVALQSLLEAGLVRESLERRGGRSYGAVYFEPVPDAALVLGFDLGARFLRAAVCDLTGRIRARQDVEVRGTDAAAVVAVIAELRDSLLGSAGQTADAVDGAVVGIPGVVDAATDRIGLTSFPGLEEIPFRHELARRLELPVTLENDINLAAIGEHAHGVARGVDDFVFLSIGTGMGAGLVLRGELHRGHHGAAGEVDYALVGADGELDPSGAGVSALAARVAAAEPDSGLTPPFDARAIFTGARGGDRAARAVVAEVARRIAAHVAPIAAVADVALVVLGGGLGANGDLLLEPVRSHLERWMPYPPRVEVSSLGEAAVLTGALAIGLRAALENVFVNRVGGVPV
jgi:predicted NBD/HSP70 family sugar kinase